ncbi:unnamed protein product [Allacma fusca]|uniref:Uncharacterized protein n=1 Tax=Allacma fusca TaxID=39272 RepID=A0A8J2PRS7_9HEXA|nr:unnamed protein product [Allacma fusca]
MEVICAASYITILLSLLETNSVFSASSCYDCSYRQNGGDEDKNKQCLNPKEVAGSKTSCPKDKPTCIKATAMTQKFGVVMERGCFPQMPSSCKDLEPMDNSDPSSLFFGATLSDVQGGDDVKFADVRACFCDWDDCNAEQGHEVKSTADAGSDQKNSDISGQNVGDRVKANNVTDGNNDSKAPNKCVGDPSKCPSRSCYKCKLGIECSRMRYVEEQKCKTFGRCFVFTKVLAAHNFTERGCGSCANIRSSEPDIQDHTQHCFSCNYNLCNSLAVSCSSSFLIYVQVVCIITLMMRL